MNQQPIAVRPTYKYKTKEDFLHWLQEKKALEKQAAAHFTRRAVMVWVDEGGRTVATIEETQSPPGD